MTNDNSERDIRNSSFPVCQTERIDQIRRLENEIGPDTSEEDIEFRERMIARLQQMNQEERLLVPTIPSSIAK